MQLTLRYSVQSELGRRSNNEDAAFAGPRLLALADGMGGHAAGEVAATLAINQLMSLDEHPASDPVRELRKAVSLANAEIGRRSIVDPGTEGMGTTLTALLFAGNRLALAHVGDSRAYLVRKGCLQQITSDDTLVQSLVDEGRLNPEQARRHPRRSVVTKVLTGHEVEPYVELREVDVGDRYFICSDGLSDYLASDLIEEVLRIADPLRCPQELIRLALQHGSRDNITCVVADVVEGRSGFNIAITTGAPGITAKVVA